MDGIISEGKRGLELGGDEFRYGLVGKESAIASEFLDQGGGGEVGEIQNLQLVKNRDFPSSRRDVPSERPVELPNRWDHV